MSGKNYCVYKHVNKVNGKRYIGMTRNVRQRWRRKGYGYRECPHFHNAIQLYGWDSFEHKIIKDNLTHQEACDLEIELIAEYDTRGLGGYNLATGGSNAITTTLEQRLEHSKYMTERNSNPETNPLTNGKVIWGETHPCPTAVGIKVTKPNGEVKEFESISQCARYYNISHTHTKRLAYRGTPYQITNYNRKNKNYDKIIGYIFEETGYYISGEKVGESETTWLDAEKKGGGDTDSAG